MEVLVVDARGPGGLDEAVRLVSKRPYSLEQYLSSARRVVEDVKSRCYEAVREYSERFDGISFEDPIIDASEAGSYYREVSSGRLRAIRESIRRVRLFQEEIKPKERIVVSVGWVEWAPIGRVGAYVPGGRHPYPSTAIMTVVPAVVAGVGEVLVSTPPCRDCGGLKANPLTVVASFEAGADAVIAVGGPQAVAAMAFGCEPIPRVDKIVGPGSGYVQAAKLLVSSEVGIDMIAGPTELAAVAGCSSESSRVALELAAQAEHGPDSMVVLLTPCEDLANEVSRILRRVDGSGGLGRAVIVIVRDFGDSWRLLRTIAPEHLYVDREALQTLTGGTPPAGVVSVDVPTAFLDYVAGPSHVLPTGGAARWRSGLSVYDFLRPVAFVEKFSEDAALTALELAEGEGFELHASSLKARVGM